MRKEIELATTAASGAFHLLTGKILSRAIGIISGIVLIRLLGPAGYGLVAIAGVAPGVFMLFSDFGVSVAMTKYLAEFRSSGNVSVKSLLYTGVIFSAILSSSLTILCFLSADAFAMLIGKPYVALLIRVASLSILAWALFGLSEAVFLGLDATKAYAGLMLLQEILGALLPISLVMYGLGVLGALLGMAVATLTAGLGGVLVSVLFMLKMHGSSNEALGFWVNLKKILRYGVPLAVSGLIVTAVGQIYSFMLAAHVFEYEIGNYNAADKLISPISYLAFPIVTVLFPAFAKINPKKDVAVLKKIFKYSVKYSNFLIMPATLLMVLLARPLTVVLFGVEFENAWIYFALLAIFKLDYGLGNDQITRLLMAQGETTFIAKIEAFSALIGVALGLILIPSYGVLGLILIRSITSWPYYAIAARKAYKSYGIMPPFRDIGKLYVSLAITALAVLPVTVAPINDALKVVIGSAVGLIILVVALPITGAIKERDTHTLTELIRPQPFIGKIADKILRIMGRIANFT